MATKKLINDPANIIDEMLEGAVAAHPRLLKRLAGEPHAVITAQPARPGKVGLVIGGGSGHEPMFFGYVGQGLADAAVIGHVFTSPSPEPIYNCARAANAGAGVLFMYGNYAGDVMNFDMAAELAAADGIEIRTIVTTDDIASAPVSERQRRRGVAGNFFVYKITGAACDRMLPIGECERLARKANARTYSMGVALEPCSMPQTLKHNFEIGPGQMEMGMGIHGEPGMRREALKSADEVANEIIDRILMEMAAKPGDRVAVLVNSLGATSQMELFILNNTVAKRLKAARLETHATWAGSYCTSLEMAGASITVIHLDDELQSLLDHPCHAPALRIG